MTRRLLFIIPLLLLSVAVLAAGKRDAETRKVLDKAVQQLTERGGISFSYLIIHNPGKENQTRTSGSMDVMGRKFHLKSPEMLSWYDGTTQWSMIPNDTEVNMSEPSPAEQQSMNPTLLLQVYKKGFYYKMKKDKLSTGEKGYRIFLNADNRQQKIREMYIEITDDYRLTRISMREGKNNWMRILLTDTQTGKQFPDSHFTFPAAQYPEAEIIDLR